VSTTARHGSATIELLHDTDVRIRRDFAAPKELVFDAVTKAEHVRHWFNGRGTPLLVCEIDLRVGGEYRFVDLMEGTEYSFHGTYLDVERPTKTVETWVMDQLSDHDAIETVRFSERDGLTTLEIVLAFRTAEGRDAHVELGLEHGVQSSFDGLEDLLSTLA
jgi:uncharacterized protein YndB with AHSA1/START domain